MLPPRSKLLAGSPYRVSYFFRFLPALTQFSQTRLRWPFLERGSKLKTAAPRPLDEEYSKPFRRVFPQT